MKRIMLPGILLLALCSTVFAQIKDTGYQKQWMEIDSLIQVKGLPKTALKKVNALYAVAKTTQHKDEMIKALLYRLSLEQQVTETSINQQVQTLTNEINNAGDATVRSVLQAILAGLYRTYFNNNAYRFYERSVTAGFKKNDITTWSADDFDKKIASLYAAALQPDALLQKQPVQKFDAVILKGNTENLRPTLYDLLAHKALDYFKSSQNFLIRPSFAFEIDDPAAMGKTASFTAYHFSSADTSSHQLKALLLFQQLMQFHHNDIDASAFIDVNLERIVWVNENGVMQDKDRLYKNALEEITSAYPDYPFAAQAWYLLAKIDADNAAKYQPFGDTSHRFDYVKAKQLIETRLQAQPAKSEGNSNMQQLLNDITQKDLHTQVEAVNIPGEPFRMYVQYRNVQTIFIRIIKADEFKKLKATRYDKAYWNAVTQLPYQDSLVQSLPDTKDHQRHATEIKMEALEPGSYVLLAASSPGFNDSTDKLVLQQFDVSSISYVSSGSDYFVLDREDGQPIKNVKVKYELYQWNYQERKYVVSEWGKITPDANGYFSVKSVLQGKERNYTLTFYAAKDSLKTRQQNYYMPYTNNDEMESGDSVAYQKEHTQFYFFTDRSIYRPGQTVYFKAIAITRDQESGKPKRALINEKVKLFLRDFNGRQVDSVSLSLNSYGSLTGSFKLPQSVLTGAFSIAVDTYSGNADFNVEEYKRPKFYVAFDTINSSYRLNDSITITGYAKAYAGNAIDGAKVKFNIRRDARYIYPWLFWRTIRPRSSSQQIKVGEVTTGADGRFEIRFAARPDLAIDKATEPVFDFSIDVSVTDNNGETRDGSTLLSVGYHSLQLGLTLPGISAVNTLDSIGVSAMNLAGLKVPASVRLNIYPLISPAHVYRKRYWERPDQFVMTKQDYENSFPYDEYADEADYHSWQKGTPIYADSVNTANKYAVKFSKDLIKLGWYAVEAVAKDKDGNDVKTIEYLQVYDEQAGSLPSLQPEWSVPLKEAGQPGEKAKLLIGTSEKAVHVIQQLQSNTGKEQRFQYSYCSLDNQQKAIEVDITEESRKGSGVFYAFVKHNRIYTGGMNVTVPYPDKDLQIVYKTFRDKTEPGSKEQWTVEVNGNNGEKAAAELLTAMYDASLDQFRSHYWSIPAVWNIRYTNNMFEGRDNFSANSSDENYLDRQFENFEKVYDALAVSGEDFWYAQDKSRFVYYRIGAINQEGEKTQVLAPAPMQMEAERQIEVTKSTGPKIVKDEGDLAAANVDTASTAVTGGKNANDMAAAYQPRRNFNETAFFIPQLYADSSGLYSFSFTMPEALTQWKWMTFAYTKDLAFGYKEEKIISQKKLMVQPNLPRFVREGDQMEFVARISNMSDSSLSGKVTLELFDAATNEAIDGAFQSVFPDQFFTAEAGRGTEVQFPVNIPFGYNKPITIKIVAKAGEYADGEENDLPVLTNRMLVTESLPLYMRGDGSKQFRFEKLANNHSATLSNEGITVEYTPNPIWFAIQALPYVAEAKNECAEQAFNRFYANALAAYLVKLHPKIRDVFDQWKTDSSALKSNLEKNQELKQVLLEETPWVLDAANESQRMKNISLLFDVLSMSNQMQSSLQTLKDMQLPDGSFPWFKGGYSDRYITQYILTGMGRLKMLKAIPVEQAAILNQIAARGLAYCDNALAREYHAVIKDKAYKSRNYLSASAIQHLFMRSYFPEQTIKNKEAYNFYLTQAAKFWNKQSVYMKGMIAAALFRNNYKTIVQQNILPSILENAVDDDTKGMYFKNTGWGYYWYQSPIEQQALLIELLSELASYSKGSKIQTAINDMRTWLLLNKQTNNWKTTKATADACYALLLNSNGELSNNRTVSIQLGNRLIQPDTAQAGTGYIKERINGNEVNNSLAEINVTVRSQANTTPSKEPSWGAVYWQYFEDLDKISAAATPLSITKKLFIETNTASGKLLTPVNDNDELKIGDKVIVRLELRSDRDMEYLHLKDMRAAAMEPINVLSEYKWQDGLGYYEATKDASTSFFISFMPKGTYVFEYPAYITQAGNFSVGIASIQCMYAPDFSAHSEGIRVNTVAADAAKH